MKHTTPPGYNSKFADFIKTCRESKAAGIKELVVAEPWVLGDDYGEVIESLCVLAESGLALHITQSGRPRPGLN